MYFVDRTAVVVKPTAKFLEWLKSLDDDMPDLTLEQLRTNCSVYLIPECDEPEEAVAYFDERYLEIFQAELAAWDTMEENWPQDMSLIAFWEYFTIEIHDMVLDMEAGELNVSRTPVREAFIHLAEESLLKIMPQRGTYVARINLGHVQESIFLRGKMEHAVMELACAAPFSTEVMEQLQRSLIQQRFFLSVQHVQGKHFKLSHAHKRTGNNADH